MAPAPTVSDYQLLGLPDGSGPDDIRRAFRQRAKSLHPDRNPSPEAAEAFRAVREAYDRLTGPGAMQQREIDRVAADLMAAADEAQRRRAGVGLERAAWQRVRLPLSSTFRDRLRRGYASSSWAVEAHAGGLDDLRWDVRLGWAEVAAVAHSAERVALTLTPEAHARVAAAAPRAVADGAYVLPTPDPSRLAAIVRRRAGCE